MITKSQYDNLKPQIEEYERISKIKGEAKCPFCDGSGVTPFTRVGSSQRCSECKETGIIKKKRLAELDLL